MNLAREIRSAAKRLIVTGLLGVGALIIGGVMLAKLWDWFVVPLGIPTISSLQAAGLVTVAFFLAPTPAFRSSLDIDADHVRGTILENLGYAFMAFVAGALVHVASLTLQAVIG